MTGLLNTATALAVAFHSTQAVSPRLQEWEPPTFQQESAAMDDVERRSLPHIKYHKTKYPLQTAITAEIVRQTPSSYIANFREFDWSIAGTGETQQAALDDLRERFHVAFQQLFGLRPFEMSADHRVLWQRIERIVDIEAYKANTPISVREVGRIAKTSRITRWLIEWVDGRKEWVRVEQMPREMPGFQVGQWIDAVVARERNTGKLAHIVHAMITPPVRRLTGDELERELADHSENVPVADPSWLRKKPTNRQSTDA